MSCAARLDRDFAKALCLPLTSHSAYVIFSDCHRGVGNGNDNFLKNEFLYLAALEYYFTRGYTYVELGDGDELWENRSMEGIKEMHRHSFSMVEEYDRQGRLYAVYGNHDMVKKRKRFLENFQSAYYCEKGLCERRLCPGLVFYPGIILKDCEKGKDIYLTHGHQSSVLNSTLWMAARFLVRYVWRPLEALGIPDPTSAAKNNHRKKKAEQRLREWVKDRGRILVTGHTHRPWAGSGEVPYFNTGSCIHPGGITGIEIRDRRITLVKWSVKAWEDLSLYAAREVLGTPVRLDDCLEPAVTKDP